ncbi:nSTAND3 domain-containing NTPase [Sutcliffiella horikoshii]|uniref:nSTAND3 domain-containing NTPase n=1 Tax=Sutcliffiella horikoshii TaxID=79883 RepID=UPI001CFF3D2B|nr:hypothetical protein [Sutcliffiella horikoshii]
MDYTSCLDELADDMRVHGAILVIGAGGSYESGMPLYAQFPAFIWRVIDKFKELKIEMGFDENIDAKDIIGSDTQKIMHSFEFIKNNEDALFYFKQQFKSINDHHNKKTSEVHEGICKLIHNGYIKLVISLNWDDLLETSWERLYGTSINSNRVQLIKPHGDVGDLEARWLLPNEDGNITEDEIRIIKSIKKDYFLDIVILGYSESDSVFVEKALKPNYKDSKVFRISPFSTGSIALPASKAVNYLVNKIPNNSKCMWEQVDFNNKKGIENAILGYRLRPTDVDACARFPQINLASKRLETIGYAIIKSEPGFGKSIMSYQLANDFRKLGWEVKKLINESVDFELNLPESNYKTVYIIDDAHQIDKLLLERLIDQVNEYKKLIITMTVSSDVDLELENIIISRESAIEDLYIHYKVNEKAIVTILNNIREDITIGNLHMETPYDYLLEEAKKEATPWLFNFYLRGGWNSISDNFFIIKKQGRSDITLVLIAVYQLLCIDKEISIENLVEISNRWGKSHQEVERNLSFLEKQKMIIRETGYRTLHLQMACRLVIKFYSESDSQDKEKFIKFIQNKILDEQISFQGINLFINLTRAFNITYEFHKKIFTKEIIAYLLNRWFGETDSESIRYGSFIMESILGRNNKYNFKYIYENNRLEFERIIENTNHITAYANSNLLNAFYNEDKDLKKKFVNALNIESFIKNLSDIEPNASSLYVWAKFLDRLRIGQTKKWAENLKTHLPKTEITFALKNCPLDNVYSTTSLLVALYYYDEEYAISEYDSALDSFEKNFKSNFTESINSLDYTFKYIFWGDQIFTAPRRSKEQKERLKAFSDRIAEKDLTESITNGIGREWSYIYDLICSIISVDENKIKNAIIKVDLNKIDKITIGLWTSQPRDLLMLVAMLSAYRKDLYLIIENHLDEMDYLKPHIAIAALPIMDKVHEKSKKIVLFNRDGNSANKAAYFLNKYSKKNLYNCKEIIKQNEESIMKNLILMHPIEWEDTPNLLLQIIKIYPEFINNISKSLKIEDIKTTLKSYFMDSQYEHHRERKSVNLFRDLLKEIVLISENVELSVFLNYVLGEIDSYNWVKGKDSRLSIELVI